ncbi:Dihydroxyacetone kinase [Lasiodiplodia theobromae]|uniref:Dihydroxyacetone kinase n=1 Tax=Lasiodiplodia theobromae TaxID=45133 RepID=UPI0015C37211|nr:Dihydroxyacetone kinase [Lasiodiplodia theobromae]KAF4541069.1 Dihydroxyacetone kinase [Lasiodiplodia theobromae]
MSTAAEGNHRPSEIKETFHLINEPADAIHEALTGLTQHHPSLSYAPTHKIVYRSDLADFRKDHVTTIGFSGGGHEPMFGGFVGPSFLSAYVSGNIFASPTAAQILEAIKLCQPDPGHHPGTLVVCGNYTGDILNAGLAITRAQALGYKVAFVPVGDDVAVGRKKGGKVGRRGLSGHLVGLKIACGVAEREKGAAGYGLDRVREVMEWVVANVGTMGVAFDRVSLPTGTVAPVTLLPPDTIELGMGAHGEPGLQQLSPPPEPAKLVARMIDLITNTSDEDRAFIPFPDGATPEKPHRVVLALNSLGSTSDVVLAVFAELAKEELEKKNCIVERVLLGPLVTSLKMSGVGITVWRLPGDEETSPLKREEALDLWDGNVDVVAWRQ